ncbi:hypothetical protein, partial [Nitrosomonas sp.]|uniref:hypothetical protein n=1 Tax=Nitrosomonas sp. TaxID=42353 RepID=UPI00260E79D9
RFTPLSNRVIPPWARLYCQIKSELLQLIPLSSLPPLSQATYWAKNLDSAPSGWKEEDLRQLPGAGD